MGNRVDKDTIAGIIDELKAIDLDAMATSSDWLYAIASAVHKPDCVWTAKACAEYRDVIVGLLEQYDPDGWSDEYLREQGLVRLPVDADGIPVRVGDMVTCDCGTPVVVDRVEVSLSSGYARNYVTVIDRQGIRVTTDASALTHYHEPTLEDVLMEFGNRWNDTDECDEHDLAREFAARLREVMGGE